MFPSAVTAWILKVCAVIAVLVVGYLWAFGRGEHAADARHEKAAAKAAVIAKAREDAVIGVAYDVAFTAETSRIQREAETNRTIACLRDGSCRLRDRFTCPRLPGPAEATAGGDDAATFGLQVEDGIFLVREASRADAIADQLGQCQAVVQAYWKATQP